MSTAVTVISSFTATSCIRGTNAFYVTFTFQIYIPSGSFSASSLEFFLCTTAIDTSESYTGDKFQGRPIISSTYTSTSSLSLSAGTYTYTQYALFGYDPLNAGSEYTETDPFGNSVEQVCFCMVLNNASDSNAGQALEYVTVTDS